MKKHFNYLMALAAGLSMAACNKNNPEPAPEPEPVKYIFIVDGGDGDGSSWEKAGGMDLFRSLLAADETTIQEDILVNDMTVAFAAGTYVLPTAEDTVKVGYPALSYKFAIEGGFDLESSGTDVSKKSGVTVFSGDANRDGLLNEDKPILYVNGNVDLTVKDIKFIEGSLTTDTNGGAIQAVTGKVHVLDCTFENNTAWYGGAISVENATVIAEKCLFSKCESRKHGGAVVTNAEGAKLVLKDCSFSECAAGGNSGVLSLGSGVLEAEGCTFEKNTLKSDNNSPVARINKWLNGSAEGETVHATFKNCKFNANVNPGASWQYTGGCFAIGKAEVVFDQCEWTNNQAFRGACITTVDGAANVLVKNSTFKANESVSHGAIYNNEQTNASIKFEGCTFEDNKAGDIGMFYADYTTPNIFVSACSFKNNSAKNYGAIAGSYANRANSTFHFDGCYFEGNYQTSRGMFFAGGATAYMLNNCQFYNNHNIGGSDYDWGVLTHSASLVCANGITLYNDASNGEQTAFGSDLDILVINSSLILPKRGDDKGLIRSNAHKVSIANNILIRPNGAVIVEAGSVKSYGHNVYGPEAGAKFTLETTDFKVAGENALGTTSFDVEKKAYVWDGPSILNGFIAASKQDVLNAIAEHNATIGDVNVGEAFKSWLESLPSKPLDRSYAWPGAYVK